MKPRFASRVSVVGLLATMAVGLGVLSGVGHAVTVPGTNVLYTTDAEFDQGALVNVNHDSPNNDQLQLNDEAGTFPFIWVSLSVRCTIAKVNTETGAILGEYRTVSEDAPCNQSSRTTVGLDGSVWVGHRGPGGVTHVGLVEVNQCVDRDGSTTIDTSTGYGDVKGWPGGGSVLSDAEDECIIHHVDTNAAGLSDSRHMSIDAGNKLWVGDYQGGHWFIRINGTTGAIETAARQFACGGYGGLIDSAGVLWSANGSASGLLRWDPNASDSATNPTCIPLNNYGLAADSAGWIWVTTLGSTVYKVSPDGLTILGPFSHGAGSAQGLAVDGNDEVWVSSSLFCGGGGCTVGHLLNDGTFVGNVPNPTGAGSTGVAVDAAGKVWTANYNSHSATRIDPSLGPLGCGGTGCTGGTTTVGGVDLTVSFPAGPGSLPLPYPYNYSDMTGSALLQNTAPQGTWTIVQDSGIPGAPWGTVTWNTEPEGATPAGSSITVEARASDTEAGLGSESYVPVTNGVPFVLPGQFIQVRATLKPGVDDASPILSDVRIQLPQEDAAEADVKVTSVEVDCPDAGDIGATLTCTVTAVVHNNGPEGPAETDVDLSLSVPFDCAKQPASEQSATVMLPVSVPMEVTKTWTVTCDNASNHVFTAGGSVSLSDPDWNDPGDGNNSGNGNDTTAVYSLTDVKVPGITVTAPAAVATGAEFTVSIEISIHNNGPISPLDGEGGIGLAMPPDCTRDPAGPYQLFNPVPLPASVTVTQTKSWDVTCTSPGVHQFIACGRAGPVTLHVREISTNNANASEAFTVEVGGSEPAVEAGVRCSVLGDPPEICGNGIDEDQDGMIDEEPDGDDDGLSDCVDDDDDGDGFSDSAEGEIGTDPWSACATHPFDQAWPPDFDNSRVVNISDVGSIKPAFGSSEGGSHYSARHDIKADDMINISDVNALKPYFGRSCVK